jgi:hypothetical protein
MNNSLVIVGAGVGSALMAAAGVFSMERLAVAGVMVMFVAAAYKFLSSRHNRPNVPNRTETREAERPHVAVGSR